MSGSIDFNNRAVTGTYSLLILMGSQPQNGVLLDLYRISARASNAVYIRGFQFVRSHKMSLYFHPVKSHGSGTLGLIHIKGHDMDKPEGQRCHEK